MQAREVETYLCLLCGLLFLSYLSYSGDILKPSLSLAHLDFVWPACIYVGWPSRWLLCPVFAATAVNIVSSEAQSEFLSVFLVFGHSVPL